VAPIQLRHPSERCVTAEVSESTKVILAAQPPHGVIPVLTYAQMAGCAKRLMLALFDCRLIFFWLSESVSPGGHHQLHRPVVAVCLPSRSAKQTPVLAWRGVTAPIVFETAPTGW